MATRGSNSLPQTAERQNLRALGGFGLVLAIVWAAIAATFVVIPQSASAQLEPGTQIQFVQLINAERAKRGVAPLTVDETLVTSGHVWTRQMIANGEISHAPDLSVGVTADWAKLGENVGVGSDVQRLHDAFVASPSHLDNIVDPQFTHIGVSVIRDGSRIFTTHRFMALRNPDPPAPRTDPTTTAKQASTTTTSPPTPPPTTAPATTAATAPPTTAPTTAAPTTAPPTTVADTTIPTENDETPEVDVDEAAETAEAVEAEAARAARIGALLTTLSQLS